MSGTTLRLVQRLLDTAGHAEVVPRLSAAHFCALVRAVGLEDCAEILAMGTQAQVLALLDDIAWDADEPGRDETFDPVRFAVWLEVLLEGSDALVVDRLAALPEELLTLALCAQLFVLDLDALGHGLAGASTSVARLADRVLDESLHLEFAGHTLIAKHHHGWDPTIAALLILDAHDHERVARMLERCAAATMGELERGGEGLYTVLRAQETLEVDAFAERDDRRGAAGYVSRSSAAAFLALARETPLDDPGALEEDPLTRAYFRDLDSSGAPAPASRPAELGGRAELTQLAEHLDAVGQGASPNELSIVSSSPRESPVGALQGAMERLSVQNPGRHEVQVARLAYLANVLMAREDELGVPHAPIEAARLALEVSAAGFVHQRGSHPGLTGDGEADGEVLEAIGIDGLFRLGWRLAVDRGLPG